MSLFLLPLPHSAAQARSASTDLTVLSLRIYHQHQDPGVMELIDRAQRSFMDEMKRSGFREGQGVSFRSVEVREGGGHPDIHDIAAEHPDVVVTWGPEAMMTAAKGLPSDIRVVYGLVFAPPAGDHPNMAGVTWIPAGEQLQALQAVDPTAHSVGVVYRANHVVSAPIVSQAERGARQLSMSIVTATANSPDELDRALNSLLGRIDILWMVPDPISGNQRVLDWAAVHKIPVMGLSDAYVELGALLALFPDYGDIGRQVAELTARILRGAVPSAVGVRSPRRTQLWINNAVRKQLGIATPPAILLTADRVIH